MALVFLAFAGMETTRNQLGLALQTLLQHPDQWRLLGDRPDLGGNAVEEVMRVNPTVTWVTREALEDVDFQGLHIPRGGIVQMLSHAAGTDPAAMRPTRRSTSPQQRPPHHGFGAGIHHCLGHFVARTDMAVALPLLAAGCPTRGPTGPASGCRSRATPAPCGSRSRFTPRRMPPGSMGRHDRRHRIDRSPRRARRPALADLAPRLLVRDPSRAPDARLRRPSRSPTPTRPPRWRRCDGVDALFMVSAAEAADRREQHRTFIDAAARAGVRHIVYTSFSGAAPDATFTLGRDHHDAEQAIRESGMASPSCATTSTSTCCRSSPTTTA